jgi:CBS domain-containing protein
MQSRLIESINVHRLLIAELSFFLAGAVVIISIFGLRNESLLFVVLIFAIYLIISGRVSQFKFVNVEIVMKDIESKQPELIGVGLSQTEVDPTYLEKKDEPTLDTVIKPKLIREAKKVRILVIKDIKHPYDQEAAANYLKCFTHAVFIGNNNKFCGFATADELLKKIEPPSEEGDNFLGSITNWELKSPIKKDIYIVKGASRKQVLDKMKKHNLSVLPIISLELNYEGVVDKESIMLQITKDFYNYSRKRMRLPVF